MKAKEEREKLMGELEELKGRPPEHCSGTRGFVGIHRASPELLQRIEEIEERIRTLEIKS